MLAVDRITGENALNGELADLARAAGRSLFDELKITGRNVAVALARGTLTVGLDQTAKQRGEAKVMADLWQNVLQPGNIFAQIEAQSKRQAAEFWVHYKSRDRFGMQRVMSAAGIDMELVDTPYKGMHWNKRVVVMDPEVAHDYRQKIVKQVGRAKASWAMAADDCGGHRGIPAWASGTKHPDANGGAIITPGNNPSVTLYSRLGYIEDAMVATSIFETVRMAENRLIKRLDIIVRKEIAARKLAA